jgi:hypothetical protein
MHAWQAYRSTNAMCTDLPAHGHEALEINALMLPGWHLEQLDKRLQQGCRNTSVPSYGFLQQSL